MLDSFQDIENASDFSFVIDLFTTKLEDAQFHFIFSFHLILL